VDMRQSIELPNNWSMINGLARRIRVAVEGHSPAQAATKPEKNLGRAEHKSTAS